MPDTAQGSNATVALRLAEAFRRHGVTLTFGQSLPSAFHLACPHVGIDQKVYRQENAGGAMADVVKITVYVTDIANNTKVWDARREFFSGDFPASTLVEVSALAAPEILVEIDAIAHIGKGRR